jgi:hypothetical protein
VKWSVILSMMLPCNGLNDILITPHRMGISALRKPNTVCFRGYERPLNQMLQSSSKIFRGAASDPKFLQDNVNTTC